MITILRPTHRVRTAGAVLAAAGLLLAACGGDDDSNSATPEVVIDGVADAAETTDTSSVDGADGEPANGDAGGNADAAESGADADATDEELALEFAQCMRDEGIDWPDPVTNADGSIDLFGGQGPGGGGGGAGDGAGGPDEATQAAFQTCGELIEGASFFGGRGQLDTETQDELLEFAQCPPRRGPRRRRPRLRQLRSGCWRRRWRRRGHLRRRIRPAGSGRPGSDRVLPGNLRRRAPRARRPGRRPGR